MNTHSFVSNTYFTSVATMCQSSVGEMRWSGRMPGIGGVDWVQREAHRVGVPPPLYGQNGAMRPIAPVWPRPIGPCAPFAPFWRYLDRLATICAILAVSSAGSHLIAPLWRYHRRDPVRSANMALSRDMSMVHCARLALSSAGPHLIAPFWRYGPPTRLLLRHIGVNRRLTALIAPFWR